MNSDINVPEVRLVGVEGEQLGIVLIADALRMAEEAEVDLVEIAPTAKPPVCKMMDFGKFKYREAKRRTRPSSSKSRFRSRKSNSDRELTKATIKSSCVT